MVLAAALVACFSSLDLSSTSQLVVTVDYSSYDFGIVQQGTQATSPTFTVSPQGPTDDDYVYQISFDQNCPDFGLQGSAPIGGGGGSAHVYNMCTGTGSGSPVTQVCDPVTYQFDATFKPSSSQMQSCVVRIYTRQGSGSGTGSATIFLSGSGQGQMFSWDVQPLMVNLGSVPIMTTGANQGVSVHNTGTAPITVNVVDSDPVLFPLMAPSSNTIGIGGTAAWKVACHPPLAQPYGGMLTFSTSTVQGGLNQQVQLTCAGTTSNVVTTPNPIDMGQHLVGDGGKTVQINLQNSGGAPAMLSGFTITTAIPSEVKFAAGAPPGPITLGAGQTIMDAFDITYTAETEQPSGTLGALQFADASSMQTIPIIGSALTASIGTNPAAVEFGTVCAGATAPPQDVTVAANASGTVRVSAMQAPTPPFGATTAQTFFVDLPAGGSGFTIHATAMPTMAGDFMGKIALTTDIPNMAERDIPVHATAIAGGNAPSPDMIHFGSVGVGITSPEKDVTLTNCSATPLMVNGTHLDGVDKVDFVSPTVDPTSVPMGGQIQFHVVMSPRTAGVKSASLVIDDDAGGALVPLDGTAFGGTDNGNTDRHTYYACSSGGPAAAWPVMLALLFLRRRKRA